MGTNRIVLIKVNIDLFLRYLATGATQIHLAMSYRVSPASVSNIIRETMRAIIDAFGKETLSKPTEDKWRKAEKVFRHRWNFPMCVGAIDGKHVRIRAPKRSGSLFYNYKNFFSVVLLAVVGPDYEFMLTDHGAYGSTSDSAIFGNSAMGKGFQGNTLNIPPPSNLPGTEQEVPHMIVGDGGFPLSKYLLRPYKKDSEEISKKVFNYRLSRARRVSENAFGIWAARWRILHSVIDGDQELVGLIIESTMILHNYLRMRSDDFGITMDDDDLNIRGNWRDMIPDNPAVTDINRMGSNNYSSDAYKLRETFKLYFNSEDGQFPAQFRCAQRGTDVP
jgi:hypothetical protein